MATKNERRSSREEMSRRFRSDVFLASAVQAAVQAAVQEHKRAGNAVVGWRNGQVVELSADEIPVPAENEWPAG